MAKRGELIREMFPGKKTSDLNREERNAFASEWARRNPDKRRVIYERWRKAHREQFNAKRRIWRAAHREQVEAAKRKFREEHPELVAAQRVLSKLRRERVVLDYHMKWHYDFTLSDYEALLTSQGHRCAICGSEQGNDRGHRLYVDHCHKTGVIRGLLCGRCNSALGYFSDSPKRLRRAAVYLEGWRKRLTSSVAIQPLLAVEPGSVIARAS